MSYRFHDSRSTSEGSVEDFRRARTNGGRMKVVLFCGGLGTRLRDYSESIPKPMALIGYRPILWHVMKYYAHFGHREFILCLGYKADVIKRYFLDYDEALTNDFILSSGGKKVELLDRDIEDWSITFVDTGMSTNIGGRLLAVEEYLEGEEMFLANYADTLTDVDLTEVVEAFQASDSVGSFLCVRPSQSFHLVSVDSENFVQEFSDVNQSDVRINGGFFVLRREIFDYMKRGEELVEEPFQRLIAEKRLTAFKHDGFWACMDTFKEKQELEDLYTTGRAPWQVFKSDQ